MVHTWGPRGGHFQTKSGKWVAQNVSQKSFLKKKRKVPKFCKNDAKMEAEIKDLSYLSLEAKIARNYCIYNIFLGFGHVKSYENP